MSTDRLYKSGVNELNGDVTPGLSRPLEAKTTSGQNLKNYKSLKHAIADRQLLP